MISMIRHGNGPMGHVVRVGEPVAFHTQKPVNVTGAPYAYINQAIPGAAAGAIYHNAPNLTLDIHSTDKSGVNHYAFIETLQPGATITIGTQSATLLVRPTYAGGGMWSLNVNAWPALVDGNYNVTITP